MSPIFNVYVIHFLFHPPRALSHELFTFIKDISFYPIMLACPACVIINLFCSKLYSKLSLFKIYRLFWLVHLVSIILSLSVCSLSPRFSVWGYIPIQTHHLPNPIPPASLMSSNHPRRVPNGFSFTLFKVLMHFLTWMAGVLLLKPCTKTYNPLKA